MRFVLVDRISELEPGARILAHKNLTLAEEYLADHFPGFPVMPGVLMLEAMTQAAAWLIRVTEDFAHSVVTLKEARNVKYGHFVEPGKALTISVEILELGETETKVKASGTMEGHPTVSARLVLERYNLADRHRDGAIADEILIQKARELYAQLYHPVTAKT